MRAERDVEPGQEPQALADPPLPGHPATPALVALRARLIGCLKSRIHEPDWQLLLQQTESFADIEIHYGYYWREGYGGVLPDGYDASSVAAEALAELVNEQPEHGLILVPRMLRG